MKVLITHEGQQSTFKRIKAMQQQNIDVYYATTFYFKKNIVNNIFRKMLKSSEQKRLDGRRCECIEDNKVYIYSKFLGIAFILINRIDKSRFYRDKVLKKLIDSFSKKIIKLIKQNKFDMVIVLGESADKISDLIYNANIDLPVIKDTTCANANFCNKIYENDVIKSKNFGRDMYNVFLKKIKEGNMNKKSQHYFKIIVSSLFVANSYKNEFKHYQIKIVNYGMDVKSFTEKTNYSNEKNKLEILYVGNIDERKGIYYINELAKKTKNIANYTVIGDTTLSKETLEELKKNVSVRGRANHDKLPEIYRKYDIFLFPSLSDSFGNVVAEAMASGLTVICSKNAGASDLIQNKVNGFVIEYDNIKEMKIILLDLYNNRTKIKDIGHKARNTAIRNNISFYEKNYVNVLLEIMREWNENKERV